MTRLVFLGTASALPAINRTHTFLAFVDTRPGVGLLIDCGGDVYSAMQRAGLGLDDIGDLLITHAHIDHLGSLPSLLECWRLGGRTAPLRIWALPEVLTVAQRLVAIFDFEIKLDQWTFDVQFHPIHHDQRLTLGGLDARILRMDHAIPSVGVRLELPQGAIAYTSDTQPNPHLPELASGARMLITECTFLRAHETFARAAKHMTAYEAGQQAAASNVKTLALVHLGVGDGWTVEQARSEVEESFSGELLIPNDGDTLAV